MTDGFGNHTRSFAGTSCAIHRISADEAEYAVLEYVKAAIQDAGYLNRIESNILQMRNIKSLDAAREKRSIKEQMKNVEIKLDNLLLMQARAKSGQAIDQMTRAFETLSKEQSGLELRLSNLDKGSSAIELAKESAQIIGGRLQEFQRGFNKAKAAMKKRLLKNLLKQIVVSADGLHIFMCVADKAEIPAHQIKLIHFEGKKDNNLARFAIAKRASGDFSKLSYGRSDIRKHGVPGAIRTHDL